MKKSELRKLIREIISEQDGLSNFDASQFVIEEGVKAPVVGNGPSTHGIVGDNTWAIKCPPGYEFINSNQYQTIDFYADYENAQNFTPNASIGAHYIKGCVQRVPPSVVTVDAEFCCDLDATNFGANAGGSLVADANEYLMQQGPEGQMCNNNLCSYTQGTGPDYQPPSPILTQPKPQRRK